MQIRGLYIRRNSYLYSGALVPQAPPAIQNLGVVTARHSAALPIRGTLQRSARGESLWRVQPYYENAFDAGFMRLQGLSCSTPPNGRRTSSQEGKH